MIAAAHDDRVKSLVYIAALAPDEGETVADVFYRTAPHPKAPQLAPDAYGLIWMPEEGFGRAVAHKASPDQVAIMAAVQRPIAVQCIQEKAPAPAWKTTPSWYLVAEEDRMINPETQRFMAGRMGATIRSHDVDHTSYVHRTGAGGGRDSGSCPVNVREQTSDEKPMKINSVAIVTGASQGIGRATALRLARDFSAVVLAARNQDELQKTAAAVNSAGAEPQIYALDLRRAPGG